MNNKQIDELEEKCAEFIKGLREDNGAEEYDYSPFVPKEGDTYWLSCTRGNIFHFQEGGRNKRYLMDRIFRTEEEAETYIKVQTRAHELIGDWVADWGDLYQQKCCIDFDHRDVGFRITFRNVFQVQGVLYMRKEAAESLLKEFSTHELRIWSGV